MAWYTTRCGYGGSRSNRYVSSADADLDVFTEKGWKIFEVEKKTQESRRNLEHLSEDEQDIPAPKQIALILQGPGVRIKLRVLEVFVLRLC
jgi:hypothetical protein